MNDKVLEYVAAALQAGLRVTFDGWPRVIIEVSRILPDGVQQHARSTVEVVTFGGSSSDLISMTIKNWDEELRLRRCNVRSMTLV